MSMMRLVLDTNIVIDFMNQREPFWPDARKLVVAGKVGEFDLWVSSSQVTDMLYIASDGETAALLPDTMRKLRGILTFVGVADIGWAEVNAMLNSSWPNPEDALVHEAALKVRADAIITRDRQLMRQSRVPAMDCAELFEKLEAERGLVYDFVDA